MNSAVLLVVLCAFPSLTQAACSVYPVKPESGACRDSENHLHEVGSKWREHCMECTCSDTEIRCCDAMPSRIFFPADCKEVLDKTNCERYAVKKNNPSIKCRIHGAVGRK